MDCNPISHRIFFVSRSTTFLCFYKNREESENVRELYAWTVSNVFSSNNINESLVRGNLLFVITSVCRVFDFTFKSDFNVRIHAFTTRISYSNFCCITPFKVNLLCIVSSNYVNTCKSRVCCSACCCPY